MAQGYSNQSPCSHWNDPCNCNPNNRTPNNRTQGHRKPLALLIDGDNTSPKVADGLIDQVNRFGMAHVKRIYGDWTGPGLNGWKRYLRQHALQPIQQIAYKSGKNATDGAMIIDAMDLLHTGRFACFCIVSSDSDFARLAIRLREQAVTVYGFGDRQTPYPFVTACDHFVYLDTLAALSNSQDQAAAISSVNGLRPSGAMTSPECNAGGCERTALYQRPHGPGRVTDGLLTMIKTAVQATADENGLATLASVGLHLATHTPDFDVRHYGFGKLSDLVDACAHAMPVGMLTVGREPHSQNNGNGASASGGTGTRGGDSTGNCGGNHRGGNIHQITVRLRQTSLKTNQPERHGYAQTDCTADR